MPIITSRITSGNDVTVKGTPLTNAEIDANFIGINDAIRLTEDLTGFVDRTSSTISFNDSNRTVTLAPVASEFDVHWRGRKITISSTLNLELSTANGGRYITLNPDTVELEDSGAMIDVKDYITVAYVYWDGSTAIIFGDERHSASRDTQWHYSKHTEVGAVWVDGGDISYTLNNQSAVTLGFTNLVIADEDIEHNINHALVPNGYYEQILNANALLPTVYYNGTSYLQVAASSTPWLAGTTARYNRIVNGNGSLVEAGEGAFVNYWIIATNDMRYPVKVLMGRAIHGSLMSAFGETIDGYDLPFEEIVVLYQVTLNTSSAYTINAAKSVIASVKRVSGPADNTKRTTMHGFTHAGLTGNNSDDHLQYLHISNSRTISAAHTFNGVQTFTSGIKINVKPTVNYDGANKQYVDQQALLMAFLNA
jgi:hypothetical protein